MIKISVIIPTYRPQDYLWKCLSSLKSQTFSKSDYEIILILNGDKEPYYTAIHNFLKNDFNDSIRIVVLYSEQGNVSNARNLGLDHSNGEYITFIDDDDYVSPSYLEELYSVSSHDVIGLAYTYAFYDGMSNRQINDSFTNEYRRYASLCVVDYLIPKKFFSGPCIKLIPRYVIGNRRFDVRFRNGEDSLFMFLISDRMKKVGFTSTNAIYYRRVRVNSATTRAIVFSEVILNCWKLLKAYSNIYFTNIGSYRFRRYAVAVLGLCHILLNKIVNIVKEASS